MSTINIKTDYIKNIVGSIGQNAVKASNVESGLNSLRYNVDSDIRSRRNIGARLNSVCNAANEIEKKLRSLEKFINSSTDKYRDAEIYLVNRLVNNIDTPNCHLQETIMLNDSNMHIDNADEIVNNEAKSFWDKCVEVWDKISTAVDYGTVWLQTGIKAYAPYVENIKFVFKDGTYRVLGQNKWVKPQGLARWYKPETIVKNPNVNKAFKLTNMYSKLEKLGNAAIIVGAGVTLADELIFKNIDKPIERRVGYAVSELSIYASKVAAGIGCAKVGAAIGTLIGGPIGTIVGGVVGLGLGILSGFVIDNICSMKIGDATLKEHIKETVGNATQAAGEFIADTAKVVCDGVSNTAAKTLEAMNTSIKASKEIVGDCINSIGNFFSGGAKAIFGH